MREPHEVPAPPDPAERRVPHAVDNRPATPVALAEAGRVREVAGDNPQAGHGGPNRDEGLWRCRRTAAKDSGGAVEPRRRTLEVPSNRG
ncbi:hypothetical protein ACIPRD_08310, partial [Streptomyces sp. NPDC090108]|uniref:hypothetical protein n=1 Tax=Streptomyces sp. NPDC090108 TaxID=3365947 RepID=UPI00381EF73F